MVSKVEELTTLERRWTVCISVLALVFGVLMIYWPPVRVEEKEVVTYNSGQVEKDECTIAHIPSDQAKLAMSLLAAAAAFVLYAINGLRFSKLSAGVFSMETATTGSVEPPKEAKTEGEKVIHERLVSGLREQDARALADFSNMPDAEKRILRTLWHYQIKMHPDFSRLWTFKIKSDAAEYPQYLLALGKLVERRVVFVNPVNDQCALKGKGIKMMKSIGKEATEGDYYHFPE